MGNCELFQTPNASSQQTSLHSYGPAPDKARAQKRRAAIVKSLRAAHPGIQPDLGDVTVHVTAEVPPKFVLPDIDNCLSQYSMQ